MTAIEAIVRLQQAIEDKDRRAMLNLLSPEDTDRMPDWDNVSNSLFKKWEKEVDKAMNILNE